MKKLSDRVVWSPLYGGCMMIQRMVNGAWVDWTSMQEGEHAKLDAKTRKVVKWHNLQLREQQLNELARLANEKYAKALAKVENARYKMGALSEQIRKAK